ncbi:hypothetical protein XENTR_v10002647 [Xenopus tropicalis]|nr:hypothetical protein XENTR_v10002647 [Xenopus tropicalis]
MCVCHAGVCQHKTTRKPCHPCTGYHKRLNEVLHCKDQDIQVAKGKDLKFDCNVNILSPTRFMQKIPFLRPLLAWSA